jgi:hypothetical protein
MDVPMVMDATRQAGDAGNVHGDGCSAPGTHFFFCHALRRQGAVSVRADRSLELLSSLGLRKHCDALPQL